MRHLPYKQTLSNEAAETAATSATGQPDHNGLGFSASGHPAGALAQLVSASVLHTEGSGFEFRAPHQIPRHVLRREYFRNYGKRWMRQRRTSFFSDKSCERCGSRERLELHHRNPGEKVSHRIWSWSPSRRATEIAKCAILCRGCHGRLTALFSAVRCFSVQSSPMSNIRPHRRRWRVDFTLMGRRVYIGLFGNLRTAQLAAEKYRASVRLYFSEINAHNEIACVEQRGLFAEAQ